MRAALALAEVNKQVGLLYRQELRAEREAAVHLLSELRHAGLLQQHTGLLVQILAGQSAEVADALQARTAVQRAMSLASRVASQKALIDAMTRLQSAERRLYEKTDIGLRGQSGHAGGLPTSWREFMALERGA